MTIVHNFIELFCFGSNSSLEKLGKVARDKSMLSKYNLEHDDFENGIEIIDKTVNFLNIRFEHLQSRIEDASELFISLIKEFKDILFLGRAFLDYNMSVGGTLGACYFIAEKGKILGSGTYYETIDVEDMDDNMDWYDKLRDNRIYPIFAEHFTNWFIGEKKIADKIKKEDWKNNTFLVNLIHFSRMYTDEKSDTYHYLIENGYNYFPKSFVEKYIEENRLDMDFLILTTKKNKER